MIRRSSSWLVILVGALCCTRGAHAQFPGDFFFAEASVVVEEGQTAELTVNFFVGTAAFGSALFDLMYDPTQLSVEGIGTPEAPGADTVRSLVLDGTTSVASFNASSLDVPFGVVPLASVQVIPLVSAGESIQIVIVPREALTADLSGFANPVGFAATITVTPPGGPLASIEPALEIPWPTIDGSVPGDMGMPLRRPGALIRTWTLDSGGTLFGLDYKTFDPSAPSDDENGPEPGDSIGPASGHRQPHNGDDEASMDSLGPGDSE